MTKEDQGVLTILDRPQSPGLSPIQRVWGPSTLWHHKKLCITLSDDAGISWVNTFYVNLWGPCSHCNAVMKAEEGRTKYWDGRFSKIQLFTQMTKLILSSVMGKENTLQWRHFWTQLYMYNSNCRYALCLCSMIEFTNLNFVCVHFGVV